MQRSARVRTAMLSHSGAHLLMGGFDRCVRAPNPGLSIPGSESRILPHPNISTSQHPNIPPTTPTPPADPTPSLSPNLSLSPSPRSLPHALAPSALCCPVPLSPVDRCVSVYRVDDGARLFRFSDSLQDVYAVTATDRGASDVLAVGGLRAASSSNGPTTGNAGVTVVFDVSTGRRLHIWTVSVPSRHPARGTSRAVTLPVRASSYPHHTLHVCVQRSRPVYALALTSDGAQCAVGAYDNQARPSSLMTVTSDGI